MTSTLRELHAEGLLILPNAWDAGTARLIESCGARAIATTSAAVAWSHGYADGNVLPTSLLASTVAAIKRVTSVPLSVDSEGGYSSEPEDVAEAIASFMDAGAEGINIEDGTESPDLLCRKIEAIKRRASSLGVDLFVNARTDVYLASLVADERKLDECVARAERYAGAGADGIFIPGVYREDDIRDLASAIELPLNVLAWPGLPNAAALARLGVRRLSAGSGIAQSVYGRIHALTTAFVADGNSEPMKEGAMLYPTINALMTER